MADATKYVPVGGGNLFSDLRSLFSVLKTRRTVAFGYAFMLAFVAFTVFLAFCPSPNASSSWFRPDIFSSSAAASHGYQPASIFSFFFPHKTSSLSSSPHYAPNFPFSPPLHSNTSRSSNTTSQSPNTSTETFKAAPVQNQTHNTLNSSQHAVPTTNQTATPNPNSHVAVKSPSAVNRQPSGANNRTQSPGNSAEAKALKTNQSANAAAPAPPKVTVAPPLQGSPNQNLSSALKTNSSAKTDPVKGERSEKGVVSKSNNYTSSLVKKQNNGNNSAREEDELMKSMMNCDFFDGEWVKDDSYPLYEPGSCNLIDEQFNCIQNGRPDKDYQKYKWKPKGCSLPRLDGRRMLDLLRGKRVVFVGDSLNRNMWESLICILRNAAKDKSKVYEANGNVYFRGEASYSFIFKDYNFTVELFVSPFLVQEWEMPDKNGTKKETLRLDLVGRSSDQYKDADIIIFNTGHWWTHDKTSKGEDYYQEGSHIYHELNVLEAFRRAITTWSRWVDANINPSKSMILFKGYSASHFSGGQWNSGGQCDSETVPIENEKYLNEYPPKMRVLENVLKYMKNHVAYLNITRMTDFRKDGHPSIYRKQNLSPEERKSPLRYQDCSHWCLPGVPDTWNEILYAELLMKQYQKQHQQKRPWVNYQTSKATVIFE